MTAFKTVRKSMFPFVQTMRTDRVMSNPWKLDEVILKNGTRNFLEKQGILEDADLRLGFRIGVEAGSFESLGFSSDGF